MTKAASASSKNDESRESITIDDEAFYVGDCILVKGDGVQQPFVSISVISVGIDEKRLGAHLPHSARSCLFA